MRNAEYSNPVRNRTETNRIYSHTSGDFLIGIFRLVKAAVLLAVAAGALSLLDEKIAVRAQNYAIQLTGDNHFRVTRKIAAYFGIPTRRHLQFLSGACLLYGICFGIQGVGLLYHERWAEYFTAIATASLLPVEGYESIRKPKAFRVAILLLNVAIVLYLTLQLH